MFGRAREIREVSDFDWKMHRNIFNGFHAVFDLVEVSQEALKSRPENFEIFLGQAGE